LLSLVWLSLREFGGFLTFLGSITEQFRFGGFFSLIYGFSVLIFIYSKAENLAIVLSYFFINRGKCSFFSRSPFVFNFKNFNRIRYHQS